MNLSDLCDPIPSSETATSGIRKDWQDDGVVVLRGLIDKSMTDEYLAARRKADGWEFMATPYMVCEPLMRLCCCKPLADSLNEVMGEPAGVHLNLCGLKSTTRDWHADIFLSPPKDPNKYAAVWVALGDVTEDAGPFEFVRGSHKWGMLSRDKVIAAMLKNGMTTNDRVWTGAWPWDSEKLLTSLFYDEMNLRGAKTETFTAKAGDVLIWSGYLWHRGSPAKNPDLERPAVIMHTSGIIQRPDMPPPRQHELGGWYFPIYSDMKHPVKPTMM